MPGAHALKLERRKKAAKAILSKKKKKDEVMGSHTPAHVTSGWKHKDAADYVAKMWKVFGAPVGSLSGMVIWRNVDGFIEVIVRDESIPHSFPVSHKDFVYGRRKLPAPATTNLSKHKELYTPFANVTGSISLDGLKEEGNSRCGMLIKNAITAGFVEDVIAGKIKGADMKDEYSRRIKGNIIPSWYKDKLKEK